MATNFVQDGNILTLIAPSGGVTAGVGYVIGGIFVVALKAAAEGAEFPAGRAGVHALAKSGSLTFTAGEAAFWDNTAKAIKKTASGYFKIGCVTQAIIAGDTTAPVALDGISVVAV